MDQLIVFAVLGLGAGAVTAALGIGLVMTYRGTGVINFAHAAVAMWGAFAYVELRTTGDLVLPVVIVPSRIPFGGPVSAWMAVVIALLLSAALGALTQLLVFQPLRRASLVAKIIGSLGLLTLFQNLLFRRFGDVSRSTESLLPSSDIGVGTMTVQTDRLWLAGIVMLIVASVSAVYRWTTFGLSTRAALEDETALTLSRRSPTLVGVINVGSGVALTTAVMIASSSIIPLNTQSVSLLIVPGLTAMLVGGLTNMWLAALAGLLLGVIQGELGYLATLSWWPQWLSSAGITGLVPLIVIIVFLILRGQRLPTRGGVAPEPLPRVPRPLRPRTLALIGAGIAFVAVFVGPQVRLGLATSMVYVVLALSLVVIVGLVGQVSLGQLAIAGIAAFALAKYLSDWPYPLGLLVASVFAAAIAVMIGLPALRIRGTQLAVVTLAGAVAVQTLVLNNVASNTGMPTTIDSPTIGSLDLGIQVGTDIGRLQFVYAVLVIMLLVAVATSILIGSPLGRRFLAVRGNEQAAASIGINVGGVKTLALAIAGLFAGIGGGLLAYNQQAISAGDFGVFASVLLLVYAYLGGITSVGGALIAGLLAPSGLLVAVLNQFWVIGGHNSVYELVGAIGLILMAIMHPQGAADGLRHLVGRVRGRQGPAGRVARPRAQGAVALAPAAESSPVRRAGLHVRDVTVRYGGVVAVSGVSLDVQPGEIVGVIGPNGAGKTSFVDAVTGFAAAQGTVSIGDRLISRMRPYQRYRAGLGRTWQSGELFEDLSVFQNILAATPSGGGHHGRVAEADAEWAIELLEISEVGEKFPSEISGGHRKLVGVARALAGRPSVLLADEPAAGLDTFESSQLGERLASVAASGVGVLLIEHDLSLVLRICHRVYVLDEGAVIAEGTPDQVRQDPAVQRAYIGTTPEAVATP